MIEHKGIVTGAVLTVAIASGGQAQADPVGLISDGGNNFASGDAHTLSVGLSNPDETAATVDVYLLLRLPDGGVLYVTANPEGALTPHPATAKPATWSPALTGFKAPAGLNTGLVPIFEYTFSGDEPPGVYTWFIGLAEPGTRDFGHVASAQFMLLPLDMPLQPLIHTWTGTWENTGAATSGAARMVLVDESPGTLTGTLDLDGSVFGALDPQPIPFTLVLETGDPSVFSGGTGQLGTLGGSIQADGAFAGLLDGNPYAEAVTFSGDLKGGINGAYQVFLDPDDELNDPDDADGGGTFNLSLSSGD